MVMTMTKKNKKESPIWHIFPITGVITLIGITMAIFEIPYGNKIAMAGGLWLGASFVIGVIYIAMKEDQKKKEKEKENER